MKKFKTEDMSLLDLILAVVEYIDDDKEREDFEENPSEIHIYKMALELRERALKMEHGNYKQWSQTNWETLFHESFKRGNNDLGLSKK